ncbi:MAG TPA: glycosyltransferase family protein [Anaerolineaceae bacterium]|nr:glycosyltransferase family protein [Anaerolineaceae bacterium]
MARIVAIVQARMGSSRLPGKVLKDIAGQPMLAWVVDRARLAESVAEVQVATTTDPADDAIEAFCRERGYPVFRGSVFDVLDRFYQAARQAQADIVVRLTADCPLIDPTVIDKTVEALVQSGADFAANRLPPPWKRTYPIGLDTEVVTFAALERAWREAKQPYEREHVMPYLYDVPDRFKIRVIDAHQDYGQMRWTVDTPEDLQAVRKIIELFGARKDFGWLEVLELVDAHPELGQLNMDVRHKAFDDVDERFDEHGFDPPTTDEILDQRPPEDETGRQS